MLKKTFSYIVMILCAILCAINYKIFVFPNDFAPAGVDGFCTIIQYQTGTNIGYLSLIVNVPLLIASFFLLNKPYVYKSIIFILSFSGFNLLMKYTNLFIPLFVAENIFTRLLASVFGGIVRGILYVITLNFGGSAGGVDIIAEFIRKKKPDFKLMNIIFVLNALVALYAFFVYGFTFMPAICTILYCFITTATTNLIQGTIKKYKVNKQKENAGS